LILIADGGSTSCDWVYLNPKNHKVIQKIKTKGLNPAYSSFEELTHVINNSEDLLQVKNEVKAVYFFGAGCNSELFSNKLKSVFESYFPQLSKVEIQGDIQGAVYACTDKPGVVGILGTGSNICYFNGKEIQTNTESLGYSIMDDGAGSALGRLLLRSYFYKQMPAELSEALSSSYNIDPDYVKENIYSKPFPGRFMASYAKFVFDNIGNPFLEELLNQNLINYFETHVRQFENELKNVPLHFVGSIAYLSKRQIEILCKDYGYKLGNVIQAPIDDLAKNINYYI
jgi:N-acetylglucosamine kinase-like BadF-type ATPase